MNATTQTCRIVYGRNSHLAPLFHGALRSQKLPYGLLGTGEERDREWEPRPISLFTQLPISGVSKHKVLKVKPDFFAPSYFIFYFYETNNSNNNNKSAVVQTDF